jgi:hypothetical protein
MWLVVCRFRLAALQLERLQSKRLLLAPDIESVLKSLPQDLNSMYDKMLQDDIHEDHRHVALRVLRWLAVSYRPLRLKEICEACTIPPGPELGRASTLKQEYRLTVDQLRGLLPNLVRVSFSTEVRDFSLEFAHFSVKEYLTGPSVLEHPSVQFSLQLRDAHRLVAAECLAYLYLSREMVPVGDLRRYAREHWSLHTVTTGASVDDTMEDALTLSESILSGDLTSLVEELQTLLGAPQRGPTEFDRITQWLEDRELVQELIETLRDDNASDDSSPYSGRQFRGATSIAGQSSSPETSDEALGIPPYDDHQTRGSSSIAGHSSSSESSGSFSVY